MILRRIRLFGKRQAGFTLIEIIVAMAITGLIGLGALMANAQVLNQTAKNSDYTAASRNVMNAIYWISRDAQMAHTINGTSGFPGTSNLTISWTIWDDASDQIVYYVENNTLKRSYSAGGGPPNVTVIAEYINTGASMTYCSLDDGKLTVTVTSTIGEGTRIINVTRSQETSCRPKL
jgi:prepilin-type N-terminal cleavage/methylation domain-containing protein